MAIQVQVYKHLSLKGLNLHRDLESGTRQHHRASQRLSVNLMTLSWNPPCIPAVFPSPLVWGAGDRAGTVVRAFKKTRAIACSGEVHFHFSCSGAGTRSQMTMHGVAPYQTQFLPIDRRIW